MSEWKDKHLVNLFPWRLEGPHPFIRLNNLPFRGTSGPGEIKQADTLKGIKTNKIPRNRLIKFTLCISCLSSIRGWRLSPGIHAKQIPSNYTGQTVYWLHHPRWRRQVVHVHYRLQVSSLWVHRDQFFSASTYSKSPDGSQ